MEDVLKRLPGVNMFSNGTGAKPTVIIRGVTSYTGNDPLVIVDGNQSLDDMNSLEPSDIKYFCFEGRIYNCAVWCQRW